MTVMNRCMLTAIQFLLVPHAFGQSADIDKFADDYFTQLGKSATAVFYTSCKTQTGKAVLLFDIGGKQGRIFELEDGEVTNTALVNIAHDGAPIDISETQGGIYTYTVIQNHVTDMLILPFTLVFQENVRNILDLVPRHVCLDKPPP